MNEESLIRDLLTSFARDPAQLNDPFTSDAELVRLGEEVWGVTVDEFSAEEDLFTIEDPGRLGANLVTATLSDLFACGAQPRFFLSALCLPRGVSREFVAGLSAGMAATLREAGCCLLGGDLGTADPWRMTGCALGPVPGRPLTRVLPPEPQRLWVTGALGDANLAALRGTPTPQFELRLSEAALIRRYATACIDTSGGFLDAAWQLRSASPGLRLQVALGRVPLADGLADLGQIPPQAALVAGAGEYELLFATPAGLPPEAEEALRRLPVAEVGTAEPHAAPGLYVDGRLVPGPPPCPREAADIAQHLAEVLAATAGLLAGGPSGLEGGAR